MPDVKAMLAYKKISGLAQILRSSSRASLRIRVAAVANVGVKIYQPAGGC
jgi:hypothetical protein